MGRKSEIGRYSRSQRYMRTRRARLRILKWMEESGELSATFIMAAKLGRKKKSKRGRPKKLKETPAEESLIKEEHENLLETQNTVVVKVEFETEEEMEERLARENYVKVENITLKVEPVDDD